MTKLNCDIGRFHQNKVFMVGLLLFILLVVLSGCAVKSKKLTSQNTEIIAMLSDPLIRSDFRALKVEAQNAVVYQKNNKIVFSDNDVKILDILSTRLIDRLTHEYHLTAAHYKIHTFIGKNEYDSCYEYYNSYHSDAMGKSCNAFSYHFGSCKLCNNYIKTIRSRRASIIHAVWWNNEKTMTLVDTFRLKNGEPVYLGLEISMS